MKRYFALTSLAATLALLACNSDDVENTPVDDMDEIVDMDDAYPVAGDLTDEQQANFDKMDRASSVEEYERNREAIAVRAPDDATGTASDTGNDSNMSGADGAAGADAAAGAQDAADTSGQNAANSAASGLRPRSQMDFAYLDRNDDGKLSVAEYAIWAARSNPTMPKPDDQTKPYTAEDQINEAGQTFFYFDEDGSTYLSPAEFSAARASARTPG